MNKLTIFLLSILPLNIKPNGTVKFSFGNLALQVMTGLLIAGLYLKWFVLRSVESADILGIAGLVFGTGYLTNQHRKIEADKEKKSTPEEKPEKEDKPE